ncbi:hypothetical protein GWK47_049449 [Chionoecetes opilio]|uniref:Uncharacterized protein n=1 Tax=Chionoecetes opilio TaxID=41210 RepID=A0A8J4YEP1_CHIOP|nr:hypothetical protein GWK47_049449 [Chionoecetes opilio]
MGTGKLADKILKDLGEAGMIGKWTVDVLERAQFDSRQRLRVAAEADSSPTQNQDSVQKNRVPRKALTVVHMQGPLFLFVAGAFFSLAAFLGENFVFLYRPGRVSKE